MINEWKQSEVAFLAMNYADKGPKVCAEYLGRSIPAVHNKAAKLGLTVRSVPEDTPPEYGKGRMARQSGLSVDSCPYSAGRYAAWWRAGWHDEDIASGNSWTDNR